MTHGDENDDSEDRDEDEDEDADTPVPIEWRHQKPSMSWPSAKAATPPVSTAARW